MCKMILEQRPVIFHATLGFRNDGSWYDWCLVKWVNNDKQHNAYPGKILGFVSIHNLVYGAIQSSSDLITMEQLSEIFICNFVAEDNQQTAVVEIETISNCVFSRIAVVLRILTSVYSQRGSGNIILERRFLLSKHFCHSLHNKMHVLCQLQCPIFLVTPKVCSPPLFICAHPRRSTTPCQG
jgi:hypothetical protein